MKLAVDFSAGNSFLVPGATVATILMLGALHARHIYEDKKVVLFAYYSIWDAMLILLPFCVL